MPKIARIAENVVENLEKMAGVDGLQVGWVSQVSERGDPKPTRQHQVFYVGT